MFCIPKAAVLHGKSVGFAAQKSRFRNVKAQFSVFNRIIFTKSMMFSAFASGKKEENCSFNNLLLNQDNGFLKVQK
ncbi:hypothetical protein CTM53_02595 [Prevotella intermedia]|uniref:Uncharacterized protein n=1 Tax=Prevotella intermedia TaxID=28131 RepID=A0AAJ3RRK4_PREIN|nr:hypothetical protein CTM61_07235 [Prevotella intermedia]PJI19803.1 hypothetical protein CTM53_02595 [Prevotella intermedia]